MADGDGDALFLKPLIKGVEPLPLGPGLSQIQTVGGGKVAEKSLGLQSGELGDFGADRRILPGALESQTAHAGVHGEVEFGGGVLPLGLPAQKLGILPAENGGADI